MRLKDGKEYTKVKFEMVDKLNTVGINFGGFKPKDFVKDVQKTREDEER